MNAVDVTFSNTKKIIDTLGQLLERTHMDSEEGALAKGKLAEFNQRYSDAAEAYASISSKSCEYSEAQARLAITLLRVNKTDQALEVASQLVRNKPDATFLSLTTSQPYSAYTVLADAQTASGLTDNAIGSCKMALELEPTDNHAAALATTLSLSEGHIDVAKKFASSISRGDRYDDLLSAVQGLTGDYSDVFGIGQLTLVSTMPAPI